MNLKNLKIIFNSNETIFYYLIFLRFIVLQGQEIYLQVIDSITKDPIPFTTILTNFNYNTISNEEGFFRVSKSANFSNKDSLFVSCMGFKDYKAAIAELKQPVIELTGKDNKTQFYHSNISKLRCI